jgi:hypothetical protein
MERARQFISTLPNVQVHPVQINFKYGYPKSNELFILEHTTDVMMQLAD